MTPHLLLSIPVVLAVVLYTTAFKDGKPTCDHYIMNTYIYTIFYLALVGYFVAILMQYDKQIRGMGLGASFGIIVAYIILYLVVIYIPKDQLLLKHLVSIVYIFIASLLLVTVFLMFFPESIIMSVLMTIVLFVILSIFAWKFQNIISSKIPLAIVIIFILLAIAEFLIGMLYPGSLLDKAIILIVLMIICYLVLVKTKRMIEQGKSCIQDGGPDYVKESIGFLLSFQNMVLRILELFGKRKRFSRR